MRPDFYVISRDGPGVLATMARPRGGDWLADEMSGLVMAGMSVLVSLLTDAEMTEVGLSAEATAARDAGLDFYRLPTPDRHVPDQEASLALARILRTHLAADQGVAIHCRNGIGRCSTLAAIILVLDGIEPDQAWALISAARGLTVPDTADQQAAVARLRS
jgi:protein-tyrosine phosphatase